MIQFISYLSTIFEKPFPTSVFLPPRVQFLWMSLITNLNSSDVKLLFEWDLQGLCKIVADKISAMMKCTLIAIISENLENFFKFDSNSK